MKNLFSIEGKVAVVTGGSRGIGEMIAAGFLANGAKVYISSRKADVCSATAKRLQETYGGECVSIPADLSGLDGIETLTKGVESQEERLDILVNNAGATWGEPLDVFPESGWDKVMDTTVTGNDFTHRKCAGPGTQKYRQPGNIFHGTNATSWITLTNGVPIDPFRSTPKTNPGTQHPGRERSRRYAVNDDVLLHQMRRQHACQMMHGRL